MNPNVICVFVFLTLSSICWGDFLTDLKFIKSCNDTSPVSLEVLNVVLAERRLDKSEAQKFKCFLHCLFLKYGWMDEDGGFLVHEIKSSLEKAQFSQYKYIVYHCTAIDSFDKCERSYLFTRCFWERVSEKSNEDEKLMYRILDDN
ncbi:hypothetical protein FQA39_LY14889 [Lamprigera yunnana]|nr:hypothetical protein FQA39_LY14889 [Lamprigera yunnana]